MGFGGMVGMCTQRHRYLGHCRHFKRPLRVLDLIVDSDSLHNNSTRVAKESGVCTAKGEGGTAACAVARDGNF